jgi:hypothetical protein
MSRASVRILALPVTAALLLLGGCFLPGGTAPDGCDLEPNGSVIVARGLGFGESTTSCNDGSPDTDLYRLPHMDAASFPLGIRCDLVTNGGTGATVQLDFLPDGSTELITLIDASSCPADEDFLQALQAGTPYLRVVHPDSQSAKVSVRVDTL